MSIENIKIVECDGEQWFRAKDILRCMGYSMDRGSLTTVIKKIDDEFKTVYNVLVKTTSTHSYNEAGLYQLVMTSKLETAKPFKSYVYKELLPDIRKIVHEKYEREMAGKQDQLDIVINQNTQLLKQNIWLYKN